ncbi:serine/threonine-protein kinase ATR-like [Gigantopelta aegis]|uniref:serine/threonine-protein kinase ATR-like n=1 Tax=Gigantopelta aegis TaxID=1735272 RepID=UPI001B88AD09|nr:serine/threonine-protein kinase ATR-like [Gigantopelta aegis]
MLQYLSDHSVQFGFTKLQTAKLGRSLSVFVCHLMRKMPDSLLKVYKPLRNQLVSSFLEAVGSTTSAEFIVAPLCDLIIREIQESVSVGKAGAVDVAASGADNKDGSSQNKMTLLSQAKRKRKLTKETPPEVDNQVKMPTFIKLLEKVKNVLSDKQARETLFTLEAVSLLIAVSVRCVVMSRKRSFATRFCELSSWISRPMTRQIVDIWKQCLYKFTTLASDINNGFWSIVKSAGSILAIQDYTVADSELFTDLAWIVSIPWLPNDPSWLDLKPAGSKEIGKLSTALSEKIEVSMSCECLQVLSRFPKEVASTWRIHIFKQAFGDSSSQVRLAALKSFPFLLTTLGSHGNHLINDLICPLIHDKDVEIQTTLAGLVGVLACVVSRKVVFGWDDFTKSFEPIYKHQIINCTSCDHVEDNSKMTSVRGGRIQPKLIPVEPNMFSVFFKLLESDDVSLKKAFITSLKQLFSHMKPQANHAAIITMITECLKLIKDENYFVRFQFSKEIQYLLVATDTSKTESRETDHIIVKTLKETYEQARAENNTRLQETVALTIGQLGRVAEGDLLLVVIVSLLESILSPIPLIAATGHLQLQAVAKYKKTKPQNLFVDFRKAICNFLVEAMHNAQMAQGADNPEEILRKVASTLGFADVKCFLQGCEKYMLPHLVSKATPEASSLIKLLASLLSVPNRRIMLINNTRYIFSYLMRFCQKSDVEKAFNYLQTETNFELGSLLRLHFQRVHNELLLHLSTNYHQVFTGLRTLSTNDEQYKGPKDISTPEQMADYLEPRLLGVLAFFDSQLMTSSISLQDKKVAMESLISIIRLMGTKHISSIRHKMMNTLRLGLQFRDRDFIEISCRAWNCFVRSLDLPLLGTMMSQIIATLLPLLDPLPAQVSDIFTYMIVQNSKVLHHHFHEIYFLPDMPELADANAVLKKYTDGPSSQSDLKTNLAYSIKGVTHESLDVRIHALSKLRKLLREEKDVLYDYVLGSESADPIVSQLVSVLLAGCRESDGKAECLYAECLGELGAIDPGRLELVCNNPKEEMAKFQASIDDDNFAIDLINNIIKAFLAATDPTKQDCSAYALQELLQIYQISEPAATKQDGDTRGTKLWRRFPENIQELLIPLLSSKYKLAQETDWSNLPKPIFHSKKGSNFKDWVSNWTGYLISKVKQPKASLIFQSCSASIRHNTHVALYLIPHVVGQVLQDGKEEDITEVCKEILEVLNQVKKPDTRQGNPSDFSHKSAQTVFSILDYLTKWQRHRAQIKAAANPNPKEAAYLRDPGYRAVSAFLERVPQDVLAQACFNCEAFSRSLMHFEQFVSGSKQNLQQHLDFLQRLYVSMDESDGVVGVAAIRQSQATLMQQILSHESLGQQQDAQACYERAIQIESNDVGLHQGLLHSLMELGQQNKALLYATGVIAERPTWMSQLNAFRVEAAWKLGSWDKLETFTKPERNNRSWPVVIGKILLAARERKEDEFRKELEMVRREQMGPLSAASMESGSYQRGYEYIARLHMLNDIEEALRVLADFPSRSSDSEPITRIPPIGLLSQWRSGLQMAQSSFRTQEPILTLRRTLLSLTNTSEDEMLNMQVGKWWLWSAKVARKARYLQTVNGCLLQASAYNLPEFSLEKAKWLWEKGENDAALSCLEKSIAEHFSDVTQLKLDHSDDGIMRRRIYAQTLLLCGRYSEETSSMQSNSIVKLYKDVIDIHPEWEDGHFYLAKYYDKIMTTIIDDKDRPEKQGEFIIYVVKYFGQSLQYGNQYIYQSMPRLLSLWLDYGTAVVESEKKEQKKNSQKVQAQKAILMRINKVIATLSQSLAEYQFFTAFPQLISRICHAQPDVFQQLQNLIAKILVLFPQQAMWMLMAVSKSSYSMRVKRCQEIFATAKLLNPELHKFIQDATKLTERLLELCEKKSETPTLSVSQHFKPLRRLLEDSNFSSILLPLQSAMTVTLPTFQGAKSHSSAFSDNQVFICGFEDMIEVLPSLQKPKKITMIGSDGKKYVMMCKPKDDLRKDCRLMEFNGIVNRFLHKDAESRHRQLHIRTYTVIPLNEECGLLEWVNNTHGLRHIVMKLYKEKGLYTTGKELQTMQPSLHAPLDVKMKIFREKFLPRHPSVFKEWFLRTFPDPTSWYNARLAYARTCAVVSVVGYILGLGDRHGENILFDSTNGDCVHVDFNCLFNKGETFEWPERVPFRLTHNMTGALGPMGCEGVFRRACEVTLRVMRNQMDPLMSVLKPFIYDPLVEWSKPPAGKRSNPTESGEISNEQAMNHVQNIEHRLKGILKNKTKPRGLPLSIEGHCDYLIQEATDEKNLCQMYVGWAAYI